MNAGTATVGDSSFLAGYQPQRGVFDELYFPDGQLRPHWHYLMRSLETLGGDEFQRRWSEGRRVLREHGVTYNVYADSQSAERTWQLDPLPLLIPSVDWQRLEQGLIQRAELLELIAADLYGARRLLFDGALPAEPIYSSNDYLLPCWGVAPAGGRHLPLYAADVGRTPNGEFVALADRIQAPSGSGYVLENRTVLSRMWPSILRDSHVHRLPAFFRRLRTLLSELAPATTETPHLLLLTPGPGNETYFEHAYLADAFGCSLAEGSEIVVRDQRVWLRTLDGLRRVDVILRRVDDDFCDPLELRPDSLLGTPGLLQAARSGRVAIVNPLGSSVLENPVLSVFLPRLAKLLLGEDLKLPSPPAWWCGEDDSREHVLANLDQVEMRTISAPDLGWLSPAYDSEEQRRDRIAAIRRQPHLFVARAPLRLSTAPVLSGATLEPRTLVLRTFLSAEADSYTVLAGGLARVAAQRDGGLVSYQAGAVSKDVWVLASEPERELVDVLVPDLVAAVQRQELEIPGHAADNLFWLGRYAERSDATARVLRQLWRRLNAPDVALEDAALQTMIDLTASVTGALPHVRKSLSTAEALSLVFDARRVGSLRYDLNALLRAARAVRERLSADVWRTLNALDLNEPAPDIEHAAGELDRVLGQLAALTGLCSDSLLRTEAWRFLEIGRRIERGLFILHLLQPLTRGIDDGRPDSVSWEDLLAIQDGTMSYRRSHRGLATPQRVLAACLDDESSPRSLVYQLVRLQQLLAGLAPRRQPPQLSEEARTIAEALSRLRPAGNDERVPGAPLCDLLDAERRALIRLSEHLSSTYFGQPDHLQQLVLLRR